jgi:hypothetical protein
MAGLITPVEAEIMAQQFPESNYELYMDGSENTLTHALPVKGGDTLVFVFNVKQSLVARVDKRTAGSTTDASVTGSTTNSVSGANPGAGQAGLPMGPYGATRQTVTYSSNERKVAFYFTIPGSGALTVGASGLKA